MQIESLTLQAMEHLSEGVIITDSNLEGPKGPKILFANKAMAMLTGYSQNELIGQTPRVLQGDNTDAEERKLMKKNLADGRSIKTTIENYKKDKTTYWVELTIDPIYENEKIINYVAIQRDVSREKYLEKIINDQIDRLNDASSILNDISKKLNL